MSTEIVILLIVILQPQIVSYMVLLRDSCSFSL